VSDPAAGEATQAQPLDGEPVARVLVAGATGLAGALAARLVWRHPRLELVAATARSETGVRLDRLHPGEGAPIELTRPTEEALEGVDAAIVALPHGVAAHLVAELRSRGARVVDLSADFRLRDRAEYERWYGDHGAPDLVEDAVYGLTEIERDAIRSSSLVANPGCYPTASLLALAPLAEAGLCGDVVIDAKSGVSGAGRGAIDFDEMAENFRPYGVEGHRHAPEIEQELAGLGGAGTTTFVPHLLPIQQGLLASCHVIPARETDADELAALYRGRYEDEPFVSVSDSPPGVREVRETNNAVVSAHLDERTGRIVAFCAIDNLWKGASSQAVQNLNLMLGLGETEGLR
jgi:N-acetyl-gamma-glutamyl-phosphate reductase